MAKVPLKSKVMQKNDELASLNRQQFHTDGIRCIDVEEGVLTRGGIVNLYVTGIECRHRAADFTQCLSHTLGQFTPRLTPLTGMHQPQ